MHRHHISPRWKRANVVPVHKKGDKKNPENYRPFPSTTLLKGAREGRL